VHAAQEQLSPHKDSRRRRLPTVLSSSA
jgi:hypothetical protein